MWGWTKDQVKINENIKGRKPHKSHRLGAAAEADCNQRQVSEDKIR